MDLTVYGDFNCPYSYLASQRVDALARSGRAEVEWRAVEHDRRRILGFPGLRLCRTAGSGAIHPAAAGAGVAGRGDVVSRLALLILAIASHGVAGPVCGPVEQPAGVTG